MNAQQREAIRQVDIYVCGWCTGSGLDREQPQGHVRVGNWRMCRFCNGSGYPVAGGPVK